MRAESQLTLPQEQKSWHLETWGKGTPHIRLQLVWPLWSPGSSPLPGQQTGRKPRGRYPGLWVSGRPAGRPQAPADPQAQAGTSWPRA